jgi:hypothetical protein
MARLTARSIMGSRVAAVMSLAIVLSAVPAAAEGAAASGVFAVAADATSHPSRAAQADVSSFRAAVTHGVLFGVATSDGDAASMSANGDASVTAPRLTEASAQRVVRRRPQTQPRRGIGVHGFVLYESTAMIASQSFDAVLGTSTLSGSGGGFEVLRLWRGLFARVVGSTARHDGSRALIAGSETVSLDIPVTVEVSPLVIGAGWRVPVGPTGRIVPYGGGGFMRLSYRETSKFAADDENTVAVFHGYTIFGGVDVGIWKVLSAGIEAEVRHAPRAIGKAGASEVFDEHDLGGSAFRVLVGVRY